MVGNARVTLVTGASGFLGPHVVAAAVERSRAVATFRDPLGPPVVAQSRGSALLVPRFTSPRDAADWVERDLLDETNGTLEEWLSKEAPTEIVHCAALARARDCEQQPELADAMNDVLPGRVAAWCHGAGARFVHVSTDLVFGESEAPSGGFSEDDEPGPLSAYGRSKLAGERRVLAACPDALVVRLPLMYGNSGARGLGASDSIIDAVDRGERPRLFVDEWRTPLDVAVAGRALVELLDLDVSGVLHVAGAQRISRFDLGVAVLRAMGLDEANARAEVDARTLSDFDTGSARASDVALKVTRAASILETELPAVRAGLEASLL